MGWGGGGTVKSKEFGNAPARERRKANAEDASTLHPVTPSNPGEGVAKSFTAALEYQLSYGISAVDIPGTTHLHRPYEY